MRPIKEGELYSLDRRASLDTQVARAIGLFVSKHGKQPTAITWNPKAFKDAKSDIKLSVDKDVPPDCVWLELEAKRE